MIWQMIEDWFRGILTDGILSNLSGLFDSVNTEVGEIATQVGTTPAGWNAGIFNMIRSLSENVIDVYKRQVYPRFQPGQILPGMCRTHEADQRRKAQAETTGEMSRFRG